MTFKYRLDGSCLPLVHWVTFRTPCTVTAKFALLQYDRNAHVVQHPPLDPPSMLHSRYTVSLLYQTFALVVNRFGARSDEVLFDGLIFSILLTRNRDTRVLCISPLLLPAA